MSRLETLKQYFQGIANAVFKKPQKNEAVEVPDEWLSEDEKMKRRFKVEKMFELSLHKLPKIRFPKAHLHLSLRPFTWLKLKRLVAGLSLVFDFLIFASSISITGNAPISLFFVLHAFFLLDYLWKTKSKNMFKD